MPGEAECESFIGSFMVVGAKNLSIVVHRSLYRKKQGTLG